MTSASGAVSSKDKEGGVHDATVIQGKSSGSLLGPPLWSRSAHAVEEQMAEAPLTRHTRHTATRCHLQTLEAVCTGSTFCVPRLSPTAAHHTVTEMGHIYCDNVGATRRLERECANTGRTCT